MKQDNCPCKDCEKKGCGAYHDICEKYREFKELRDIEKRDKITEQVYYKNLRHINVRKTSLRENHIF